MARALRAFRDGTGDDWDWTGALVLADAVNDLQLVRGFCQAFGGMKPKR